MNDDQRALLAHITASDDYFTKARLISDLQKQGVTIKDISKGLGLKDSYVCHIIRLNKLPSLVIDGYYTQSITLSHLFVISRLRDHDSMIDIYEKVLAESLTVLQTEELVREVLYDLKTEGTHLGQDEKQEVVREYEDKNMQIKVVQTRVKGKIIIEMKGNLDSTTPALREVLGKLRA